MAIPEVGGPATAIVSDDNRSYVDWGPIIAGAVLASALSFVLLTFGSAIGLSMTSAYAGAGFSVTAFAIAAALWLLWVQISSFFAGGYLAGRMRRRHGDASEHESDIRDGSHGLIVWAIGLLIGGLLALSSIGGAIATATTAATAIGGGAAVAAANSVDPTDLLTDRLLRTTAPTASAPETSAANDRPSTTEPNADVRTQLSRLLMSSLDETGLSDEDRAYVVATVASEAGIPAEEAEARVTKFIEEARKFEAEARTAAERARRIAVLIAFMTAASFLISGAAAYYAATLGGNHRDKQTVLIGWNRFT